LNEEKNIVAATSIMVVVIGNKLIEIYDIVATA